MSARVDASSADATLLIVDDSSVIRNRIARLAADGRLSGIRVVAQARDGEEALALAREHRPALVTMDLTMPRMAGAECIEALSRLLPGVRILVVSALADKATALKAVKRGAQGFLLKPFDEGALADALHELRR